MSLGEHLVRGRHVEAPRDVPVGGRAKRVMDFFAALALIVFFAPAFICLAIAVRLSSKGSVVFAHKRIGAGGKVFSCYKFRSMVPDASAVLETLLSSDPVRKREWEETQKLVNDPRVTKVGRILRVTSLDELPQLFNVLVGDMSLVGPRPIVEAERRHYGSSYEAYTSARPGITGLWQVSGRSDTTYATRVALDTQYVEHWSLWLDITILFRTIAVVLFMRGSR